MVWLKQRFCFNHPDVHHIMPDFTVSGRKIGSVVCSSEHCLVMAPGCELPSTCLGFGNQYSKKYFSLVPAILYRGPVQKIVKFWQ